MKKEISYLYCDMTEKEILENGRQELDMAKEGVVRLLTNTASEKDAVLREWNMIHLHIGNAASLASLFSNVHPEKAAREAAETIEQEAQQFATELGLNRKIYDLFAAIDKNTLVGDEARLVDETLRDFKRSGVDKDDATREKIKQLNEELVKIGQTFEKNIREDVRFIELESADDLAGLPEDYIAAHAPQENGKIRITTDYPDLKPFMMYAKRAALRKQLSFLAKNQGYPKNIPVLQALLQKRYALATLLGYASWAEYVVEDKMIRSGKAVGEFIETLSSLSRPVAEKEKQILLEEKKKDDLDASEIYEWEYAYYEEKVKNERLAFDSRVVRPYFEYARVKQGIFNLTSELFDLRYERVDVPVWQSQVEAYDLFDANGKRGRFYLDMHPREHKYKHAAQFTVKPGVRGVQLPESALVCNFTDPKTAVGPALMDHDQVTTFFHEFGHLLHSILGGNQEWVAFSGVATEWDFVEAPSQLFEEWTWEPAVLKRFAIHVETGEPIKDEYISRMRAAEDFGKALFVQQQSFYTSVSYEYYNKDPQAIDTTETLIEMQQKYAPFRYTEDTHFQCSFGHLDGYSAMYYTYMWSLVIAKDIVSLFKERGMMNKALSLAYRRTILEQGGRKDAAVLVEDFLGRPYTVDAFRAWLEETVII